jgi:hypothetical protein
MIHICTNCYKTFKTIQHLNQHKNRKFKCKPFTETNLNLSSIQSKTLSENKNNSNKTDSNNFENGAVNANHSYYESTDDEGGLIYTNNISSNVSLVSESSQNYSVENLSVTNLLEFVNTHKKILEEKNKLESALIILKKQVDFLTMENTDLKNKIHVVNDFISSYKKSNNNIDFNKKPFTV